MVVSWCGSLSKNFGYAIDKFVSLVRKSSATQIVSDFHVERLHFRPDQASI